MSFNNATIACGKLLGSLFLPQNGAQHKHVINAFRGMEVRDWLSGGRGQCKRRSKA